jgi:hypothetical protein
VSQTLAEQFYALAAWITQSDNLTRPQLKFATKPKFFIGTGCPSAEGFINLIVNTREALARRPEQSVNKVLGENAAKFFGCK